MRNYLSRIAVAALCVVGLVFTFEVATAHALATSANMLAGGGASIMLFGMTTLAADVIRNHELTDFGDVGVIASDIIYEGALVGDDGNGYGRPLVAGDKPFGFAETQADNSAGAAAAIRVNYKTRGRVVLSVSGAAITDYGKAVYASDDATFTFTESTNSHVGRVVRYVSSGVVVVAFDFDRGALGNLTGLDITALGALTSGNTFPAFQVSTFSGTDTVRAFRLLADKINTLTRMIKGGT